MPRPQTDEGKARTKTYFQKWYARNRKHFIKQVAAATASRRRRLREWIIRIKVYNGCAVCGFKEYHSALHFHHLSDKEFCISHMNILGLGADRIEAELRKCVVLCANCHAGVTQRAIMPRFKKIKFEPFSGRRAGRRPELLSRH